MPAFDLTRGAEQGARLARMQAISQQEQAQAARQQRLDAEEARKQGIRQQFTGVLGKYQGDVEKAAPELMAIDPQEASGLLKDTLGIKKTQLDIDTMRLERLDDLGMRVTDQHSYEMYKVGAKAIGLPVDGMPPEFNPGYMADLNVRTKQGIERAKTLKKNYDPIVLEGGAIGKFDNTTGDITPTGMQAPAKAASGGGSDYAQFLTAFAKEKGKTPETLTVAENLEARKKFGQADDRPRVSVSVSGGGNAPGVLTAGPGGGLEYAGTMARLTGRVPIGLARGGAGSAVINEAARQTKMLGQTPVAAMQKAAAYQGGAKALAQLQKMRATSDAYESKALAQLDIVDSLSDKVNRTSIPLLNRAIMAGKTEITGDADATLLLNAVMTATAEYAKIMAGGTASAAAITDSAQREAQKLLNASMNKATLRKATALMRQEMNLTMQGYDAGISHISDNLGSQPEASNGKSVTMSELQAIAKRRGTTVEQEKTRAATAGYVVR